jgi:hypothetical protein
MEPSAFMISIHVLRASYVVYFETWRMASRLATAGEQGSNWSAAVWWKPPDTSSSFGQFGVLIHSDQQVLICWVRCRYAQPPLLLTPGIGGIVGSYSTTRLSSLQLAVKRTKPRELVVAHAYTAGGDPLPVVSEPFERAGVPLLHRDGKRKVWRTISRGVGRPPYWYLIQDTYWRVTSNMSAISDWLKPLFLRSFSTDSESLAPGGAMIRTCG